MIDLDHLDTLTDTQLDSATRALIAESQRRQRLAQLPVEVQALAVEYIDAGGDPAILADSIRTT